MEREDPVTPPWEIESNAQKEQEDPSTPPPPTDDDAQMELDDPSTPPPPTDDDGQSFWVCNCIQKSSYVSVPTVIFFSFFYFLLRLTYPTPGIEPDGRMRCAISRMISVSATLDTHPRW